jgi:hypothetical protein
LISKHEFLIQEIFSLCLKFKVSVECFFNFSRNLMYLDILEKFLMSRLEDNGPNDMLFHSDGVFPLFHTPGWAELGMKSFHGKGTAETPL